MNRLIIIGAGGHGKVIADCAVKNGYTDIGFVDDHSAGECVGFPVIGKCADIERLNDGKTDFIVGVGNNVTRQRIAESYDVNWVPLIHPSAQIAINTTIGKGTVIMAGAIVNAAATIGCHSIINTGAIVEHDNVISDYVHLSPRATLSGTVNVGERTWIGTGASVINNVSICSDVTVGVGSVVIRDITEKGVYYGLISK